MTTTTATHYVDPATVVWCPSINDWTGDDLATNEQSGLQQCPECRELLNDADIQPAHHVDINDQWYCHGEEATTTAHYSRDQPIGDRCSQCGEWVY